MASPDNVISSVESPASPSAQASIAVPGNTLVAAPEKLDELEEINFLLEEIESKIAPLALA